MLGYSGDGGPATSARLNPIGLALDARGNLYITQISGRVRRVDDGSASTAVLKTLAVQPTSLVGGVRNATGTVTLISPAPAGGVVVTLASDRPGVAAVPASVKVPAGSLQANFTITTFLVHDLTTVHIAATLNQKTLRTFLTVGAIKLSSITLSQTQVKGGNKVTGTVHLSSAAPSGGAAVSLASGRPGVASVPASVTVPVGKLTATFTITTHAVSANTSVQITGNYNQQKAATLIVTP
jgi:hypothetical protein